MIADTPQFSSRRFGSFAPIIATVVAFLLLGARSASAQTAAYFGEQLGGGFSQPFGLAVDGSGNVYTADLSGNAIYEIPPGCFTSNCVLTLGAGFAFNQPAAVAVDTGGNVYVADVFNNAVERLTPGCANSTCVTSLGGGFGFNSPNGVAVDTSGNVYIADTGNSAIREIPAGCISSSCIEQLGGDYGFNVPFGVAVAANGNVYVADTVNSAIEVMTPNCASSSCVTRLGGTFAFSTPFNVTVDSFGDIFVADGNFYDDTLARIEEMPAGCASAGCVTVLPSFGGPNPSVNMALDTQGNLYLAINPSAVIEVERQGVNFAAAAVGASTTQTLTFTIYSAGTIGVPVVLTQGATGKDFTDAGTGTCTTNGTSYSYAANSTCTLVVKFAPQSAGTRYGAAQLVSNTGTILATAQLYGTGNGPQLVFNAPLTPTALGVGPLFAYGVTLDGNGDLFFADEYAFLTGGNGQLKELPAGCASASCVTIVNGSFKEPFGLAIDGSANLYVIDGALGGVYEVPKGCTSDLCVTSLGGGYNLPTSVAVDRSGNVYVADEDANLIYEMRPGCASSSCMTTLGGGFVKPIALAVDGSGNIYVAEFDGASAFEMPAGCTSSSCVTTLGGGFTSPTAIALDGNENLYVSDGGGNAVKEVPAGCASSTCVIQLGSGSILPLGLVVDGSGDVFVSDAVNDDLMLLRRSIPPTIAFATTTDVGSVDSTDGTQTVALQNIGTTLLSFSQGASFPGAFLLDNNSTCESAAFSLAVGASCTLGIDFEPTVGGTNSGNVVLTDNNGNLTGATQDIQVSGTGLALPTITFSIPEKHGADAPFQASATSNSTGAITYSLVSGPATVLSSGLVTLSGMAGTVEVEASQAAAGNYAAGTATASFTVDTTGALWLVNGGGSFSTFDLLGNPFSPTAFTGGGLGSVSSSGAIAFDASANAWVASAQGVSEFNFDGTPVNSNATTAGGITSPSGVAIDGDGNVWVANSNGTVSELSNNGTAVSPSAGYPGTRTTATGGVAIDLSGNVWITNKTANTITEIIGVAAPAAPLSTALANGTTGARP